MYLFRFRNFFFKLSLSPSLYILFVPPTRRSPGDLISVEQKRLKFYFKTDLIRSSNGVYCAICHAARWNHNESNAAAWWRFVIRGVKGISVSYFLRGPPLFVDITTLSRFNGIAFITRIVVGNPLGRDFVRWEITLEKGERERTRVRLYLWISTAEWWWGLRKIWQIRFCLMIRYICDIRGLEI